MSGRDAFLCSAVRSPIGAFGGALSSLMPADLSVPVARAAIHRAGLAPELVDETIWGHARQAGGGPNTARQVGVLSGVPHSSPAYTVNKACGSSLFAIIQAARTIRLGEGEVLLVGGVESMSNTPYLLPRARWGYRMGHAEVVDGMYRDGFSCPLADQLMGRTAETLAEQHGISRDEQDRFALESQRKAAAAWESGAFADELLAMEVPGKGGATTTLAKDEHMRPETTLAGLGKLKPVFKEGGTVHAGNSSGVTDGAAAVVVASGDAAARHGLKPLARVAGWAVAGVDPKVMGIGPVPATRKVLEKTGLSMDDLDLVELNEAFAAQAIACDRELRLDPARLNVHGGAIALGHPIGATGCRIVVTLVHALRRRGARRGLATLCVSGGMGISVLVEAV
jgi:acetyl-CoA C-acetyltransferase